jgi:transposase
MSRFAKRERAVAAAAIVGVDAGKFRHALVVRPRGAADGRPFVFDTTRAGFDDALRHVQAAAPTAAPEQVLVGIEFAGCYGFTLAHFLHSRGFPVVNVLPSDTRRWKEVTHGRALKTDCKDAVGITDLVANGSYVGFPFLAPAYSELRYLVSARERFGTQRRATIARIRTTLQLVFPEFERLFPSFTKRTPLRLLDAYPGPASLLAASPAAVMKLLRRESRGKHAALTFERLLAAARTSLALEGAQQSLARELQLLIAQVQLYDAQLRHVEAAMVRQLDGLPEAAALCTVPGVRAVTAAAVLGAVGDPRAYDSSRQVLVVAGLDLVESSSGTHQGRRRISKRGRPELRRQLYMLAVRSVRRGGIARAAYDAHYARNGNIGKKALVPVMRALLRMLFRVARDRRSWSPSAPGHSAAPVTSSSAAA